MQYAPGDRVEVRGERKSDGWLPAQILEQCSDPLLSWVRIFYPDGTLGSAIRLTKTDIRPRREAEAT